MTGRLGPLIQRAIDGPLNTADAREAFDAIMSGDATPAQTGGFLIALRMRGETVEEIAAAASVMRAKALPVKAPGGAMDIVGTGGDGKKTLNISTAAALVVAGAGVPVAKHGNRALSSASGATDVLTALGVELSPGAGQVEACLREAGMGYMAAPNHHSAMRHVMPARTEMGVRTIFNILGPLTNPAGVRRQLSGAFSADWIVPMAETLGRLGSERAWIVHGGDGTDELSIAAPSQVAALNEDGTVTTMEIAAEDAGLPQHPFEQIVGGDAAENARHLSALLDGFKGAYRDAACLNAAAALLVAGKVDTLKDGAAMAVESIDSGAARRVLENMIRITGTA